MDNLKPFPKMGSVVYYLHREGPLTGHITEITVCGYSYSPWQGTQNADKDPHFVICHNSYNMACAYELQNVYPTRAAAELAKEVKSNG